MLRDRFGVPGEESGSTMTSPSPAAVEPKFRSYYYVECNHDQCNTCGAPRSAHGPDWSCPPLPRRSIAKYPLAAGTALTLTGLIWSLLTAATPQGTTPPVLPLVAIMIGSTLLVLGLLLRRGLRD